MGVEFAVDGQRQRVDLDERRRDEVVEQVKPYVDAGFNHLVFHAPGHDQRRFLELFERDLAQPLRRLGD